MAIVAGIFCEAPKASDSSNRDDRELGTFESPDAAITALLGAEAA
jgi:hypothetical protein